VRRAFHSAFLHWGSICGMDMGIVNAAQVTLNPFVNILSVGSQTFAVNA
jgi:cobalamin-dependent methionine synthase I